ncbi:hypothetical protein AKJ16_DCAP16160 [Drosera capensis]
MCNKVSPLPPQATIFSSPPRICRRRPPSAKRRHRQSPRPIIKTLTAPVLIYEGSWMGHLFSKNAVI